MQLVIKKLVQLSLTQSVELAVDSFVILVLRANAS